ncbi:MAG: hypothetical protein QOH25_3123 [Acidobacteriota bacterium]|nr:hypothetical protein [Acidobacteriota bacterium]
MTGSHEVRGSIPLGSTNNSKHLRVALRGCPLILCAKCVRTQQISAEQELRDLLCRSFLHRWKDVRVDVHRESYAGVPKSFAHYFGVGSGSK